METTPAAVSGAVVPAQKSQVPLAFAASVIAQLADEIDQTENLDQTLVEKFNDARLSLAEAVDRRIAFDIYAKAQVEMARQVRAEWDGQVQWWKLVHERFKANTKATLEAHPDLQFQGRQGKIALQKNAQPSVETPFEESKELTSEQITTLKIEPRFIRSKVVYSLNTEAVRDALQAGEKLPWAKLNHGQHVRFRK